MSQAKTNAMRILDQKKITYETYTYDGSDGRIDGAAVAQKIGKESARLFKTLVTRGPSKSIYVFLVCIEDELDLKKAAKAAGEKSIEMVQVKELLDLTGYIRGGCSPIGMKKAYVTYVDQRVNHVDNLIVSGGKIGIQLELSATALLQLVRGRIADVCKLQDSNGSTI